MRPNQDTDISTLRKDQDRAQELRRIIRKTPEIDRDMVGCTGLLDTRKHRANFTVWERLRQKFQCEYGAILPHYRTLFSGIKGADPSRVCVDWDQHQDQANPTYYLVKKGGLPIFILNKAWQWQMLSKHPRHPQIKTYTFNTESGQITSEAGFLPEPEVGLNEDPIVLKGPRGTMPRPAASRATHSPSNELKRRHSGDPGRPIETDSYAPDTTIATQPTIKKPRGRGPDATTAHNAAPPLRHTAGPANETARTRVQTQLASAKSEITQIPASLAGLFAVVEEAVAERAANPKQTTPKAT